MIPKKLFVVILATISTVVLLVSAVQAADLSDKSVYAAANDAKVSRVLYLSSYDRSYKWSNDIERGLVERIKNADREIELSVEYLDGRRFPGTARNDLLAASLAAKYAGYRHDIVVVSDNFAFDFAIQYRKQLFPDLPIVFCGYNNFRPNVLKGISNVTGVNEEVDFAKTVELAIRVQPAVRNLVFIISTGDASNRRMAKVAEATLFPELRKGYNVIVLKDASMAEISSRLGALPPDSAVFLVGMTSDLIEGRRPTPVENGCMILAVSPVPVYSFWDFHLGTGVLGGNIIAGLDQGRAVADMVLRILDGQPADSIPVMMQTPASNIIDFNVMKKFGIKANALPEGCFFINRPVSLWQSYGWYIGAAVLAISLESLLIVALMLSLRQRREAFRMLGIERDLLEQRVEERTGELQRANELLEEEICVRNRTERVITARLRLLEFAATHSLDELLETTINEAEALTGSCIGFYHFLETDQKTISLQNWSTRTKAELCKAEGKGLHYDVSQAGVWIDCIHQRKPVIHNDYASLPHRKGMPPDHAEVIRELVLPVFRSDSIVAIIGVGNKPHDYTAEDIEAVSFLADLSWEIAERKQAEEALHLSQFCIDKAGLGIYQSDENGTIFSVNAHGCNSLGYSKDELCSLTIFDIDPEINPERMLALKEILDEAGSATHYSTQRRKDGSTFPVEITANTIDFRGKRYGISFVKDITERKRMEEELILQQMQLRKLNSTLEERVQAEVKKNREKDVMLIQQNRQAALGEILDHIAHQWKHPLATISLTAYLLKTDNALNRDTVEETTGGIINQVNHLTQMLNDYRDFYRPDKEKSVFLIREGIDKALSFITPVLSNESIEVKVHADPDLYALGYLKEYAQVILNLLSNARDAFRERKVKRSKIVVKGFLKNKMAVVTVTDNAGGINETVLGSIFEMNFTTKEQNGGTGIGLYMSRSIIESDMGGDLTATNVAGGAQFCIRLPIAESVGKSAV
jgi:PAS domain S-box-containing protein